MPKRKNLSIKTMLNNVSSLRELKQKRKHATGEEARALDEVIRTMQGEFWQQYDKAKQPLLDDAKATNQEHIDFAKTLDIHGGKRKSGKKQLKDLGDLERKRDVSWWKLRKFITTPVRVLDYIKKVLE